MPTHEQRSKLLNNIVNYFKDDIRVLGVFVSGSFAENTTDEYSDLDVRIVLEEDFLKEAIEDMEKFPKAWGNLLYNELPYEFNNCCISHFDNFLKAEVLYYTISDLTPSPWHKNISIYKDTNNLIKNLKDNSQIIDFKPNVNEVNRCINDFYAAIHETYRRLKRGELFFAIRLLEKAKEKLINLWDYIKENPTRQWYKLERRIEPEGMNLLMNTFPTYDERAIYVNMIKIIESFEITKEKLNKKYKLNRIIENDTKILGFIKNIN